MKSILLVLLFSLFLSASMAQVAQEDLTLLAAGIARSTTTKDYTNDTKLMKEKRTSILSLPVRLLMYSYQNILSPQLTGVCQFGPSCSNFSKQVIREYGWLKGIALTSDRLMRCNPNAKWQTLPSFMDREGKILDPIYLYRK